jgi:hypothetical protein
MGSGLTQQQIDFFQTNGYLFPLNAISSTEAATLRGRIEAYEAQSGEEVNKRLKIKAHLAFPWMCELARSPAIVEAVQSLIGSDVLLFGLCQKCARHTLRLLAPGLGLLRPRPSRLRHGMDRVVACDFGERLPARSARKSPRARSGP